MCLVSANPGISVFTRNLVVKDRRVDNQKEILKRRNMTMLTKKQPSH